VTCLSSRPWQDGRPIVLLGAGQLGRMALEMWPASVLRPMMILDRKASGSISGVPILPAELHTPDPGFLYVLSYFKDSPEGVLELFETHLQQSIITVYDILSGETPAVFTNGWQGAPEDLASAASVIRLFDDEGSRRIYSANLEWRYKRNLRRDYPVGREEDKYALSHYGINAFTFDLVVDAGSFDLSFSDKLKAEGFAWNRYLALEPDPVRHEAISRVLDGRQLGEMSINLSQAAAWSRSGEVNFMASGLLSARIPRDSESANAKVIAVTLSEVVDQHGTKPKDSLLVKLHIEGAEWPVIESSVELLRRPGPTCLLINLSHDEDSLTQIPRVLSELGYQMRLHSHSLFGEGLTLFAWKDVGS
jgi:FkbM family methyltransferase